MKKGDRIRIGAPGGKFFFDDLQAKAVVLIAGGVGITPLMSILRYLTDRSWGGTIYFINAIRSQDDRIYEAELSKLANRFENLHVCTFYSQIKPSQGAAHLLTRWQEKSGYINPEDLQAFVPGLNGLPIFLCGPDPMMQAVRKAIRSLGISDDQVATEEFVSPRGTGSAVEQSSADKPDGPGSDLQSATITFGLANQTVDVDTSTSILEAAEQAGVSLSWECRAGVCGQCKVRCTSGRVRMDSRDALSSAEEANGFILACQSHPVTESVTIDA